MNRILLFLIILFAGVMCSACINSYAVSQLNKNAMEYSENGKLEEAASRLEASIDLDANVYETRYNLAVVYLEMRKCDKAIEQINVAQSILNKEEPAIYYIQGSAYACKANEILDVENAEDFKNMGREEKYQATIAVNKHYVENMTKAVDAFERYLKIASVNERNPEIVNKINDYRAEIAERSAE